MPEACSLHVIVRDLDDALWPQRLPAQVLAAIPAAARTGEALYLLARLRLRDSPIAPRMASERVLAQQREFLDELPANGFLERRRDANVEIGRASCRERVCSTV